MLRLDEVSLCFEGERVIDRLSHTFEQGNVTMILGESGIGKTTILRLIGGLEKPTAGKVETDGAKVAFVFQEPRLFPWMTARENVKVVCPAEPQRADALLESMGLSDAADKYPAQLSGGMKQRVAIARALAYDADVLLLDEAFVGLDPELRQEIAQLVFDRMRGRTVIMVSHEEGDRAYADILLRLTRPPQSELVQEKSSKAQN